MSAHPATLMIRVWVVCFALFFILPFQIVGRNVTLYGFAILALFIFAFCAGSLLGSRPIDQQPRWTDIVADFALSDRILKIACLIAIAVFAVELTRRDFLDLTASYLERSDRANDLIYGLQSNSSLVFQIGFVTYPASFIMLARLIGFERRPKLWEIGLFGLVPSVVASLGMGGRSPLMYAIVVAFLSLAIRKHALATGGDVAKVRRNWPVIIAMSAAGLLALIFFAQVFFVRSATSGGLNDAMDNAVFNWGVKFEGGLAGPIRTVLGEGGTYLLFVFSWYIVQGIVLSNVIFTDYVGPSHLGIYGIDLAAALARRVNGDFVADRFLRLLDLNVIGFLPSAFGSVYVDYWFFGLIFIALWGWLAAIVYRGIRLGRDPRWLLLGPFVTMGIIFSVINTPIGFSNGFVTHFWLLVGFFTIKLRRNLPDTAALPA